MTFFNGFKKGFRDFGLNLATIVNCILLSFVYVIGVGITSSVAKIFRKQFLETKISTKAKSYWSNLNLKKKKLDDYYRQF